MSNVVALFKTSATCIIISSFTLSNSPQSSTKNSEYDAATLPPFLPLQILLNSPANNETNEVIGHAGLGKKIEKYTISHCQNFINAVRAKHENLD